MEENLIVFDVGVLDSRDREIREIHITAESETEMWRIFDRYHRPHYKNYSSAVIYCADPL